MAHPKRRHSSTRRDKRRTHFKAAVPTVSSCKNCGSPILSHRVCGSCGYYRGVIAIAQPEIASTEE